MSVSALKGITVHPRPDERHITLQDVYDPGSVVTTEFNIEGCRMKIYADHPRHSSRSGYLVPDPPDVLTSNNGWDAIARQEELKLLVDELHGYGVRVSIF